MTVKLLPEHHLEFPGLPESTLVKIATLLEITCHGSFQGVCAANLLVLCMNHLLSCQPRVTVTSCFVCKVIRDLESIDNFCINPIHRIGLIHKLSIDSHTSNGVYKLMFYVLNNRGVSHYGILPVSRDIGWPAQQLDYFRYIK